MALQGFDESYYLSAKLAALQTTYPEWVGKTTAQLKTTLGTLGFTPEQHYMKFGYAEKLGPNALFNGEQYTLFKAQALFDSGAYISLAAAKAAFLQAVPGNVYEHYLKFGGAEGINPSNDFDSSSYLATKLAALKIADPVKYAATTVADVAKAIADAGLTPLTHYLTIGISEANVTKTPVPANEKVNTNATGLPGTTFSLTTGVDSITGTANDDTVNGVIDLTGWPIIQSTLNLADIIDGGAGTDTFNLIAGGGPMPAATITNVENFFIRDVAASALDFASVTGEQLVVSSGSTTDLGVRNIDKATIGIKNSETNLDAIFKDSAFLTTAALDVYVENAGNTVTAVPSMIAVSKMTGGTGAANGVTINAVGKNQVLFAIGAGAGTISAAGAIKTMTVTGAGSIVIDAASVLDATAFANSLTKVDASANSGGVTLQVNKTTVAVTGGSGADAITVGGAMTKGAVFNLGDGNDQLLKIGAGAFDANVVADGGAGVDSVSNGLITVGNGAIFKNFEKIALDTNGANVDVELLTGSTITGLIVNKGAIVTQVQNVASGSTVDVTSTGAGSASTVLVKGAAASITDKLTVNFNGAEQAATPGAPNIFGGVLVADNVETIDIVSAGGNNTWNAITISDNSATTSLQTMSISGTKNLNLNFAGAGTNTGLTGGAVKSIDASGATGKMNIDLTSVVYDNKVGFTLKSGTGADTITTNATKATLTGGGGNDTFVVSATAALSATIATAQVTTITDFNAGDALKIAGLTGMVKTQTDIAAATNLQEAVDLSLGVATVVAGKGAWFTYSGNTYVAVEDGANLLSAADTVVKLTGTVDLTTAVVDGVTGTMTMA